MVRMAPKSVCIEYVQVLWTILDRHRVMTLAVDCMFVNGVPFLVSVSRGLILITAEYTPTRTAKNLASVICNIMALYEKVAFKEGLS